MYVCEIHLIHVKKQNTCFEITCISKKKPAIRAMSPVYRLRLNYKLILSKKSSAFVI